MKTDNLDSNLQNEENQKKSEKIAKAKKVAGKAAGFAGAAGLGAAGTIAAEAMGTHDIDENVEEIILNKPEDVVITPEENSEEVISLEEFDPNDIRIEDSDLVEVDEVNELDDDSDELNENNIEVDDLIIQPEDIAELDEIEPLSVENINLPVDPLAMMEEDSIPILDIESDEPIEVMYGGPNGWDDLEPDNLLADDDMNDILDDLLS